MNSTQMLLSIAKDFSETPGPRHVSEGKFSGEEFREKILFPRFQEAKRDGTTLLIDLDGAEGYATSFLEEAFGGLARKVGSADEVLGVLKFNCTEEPYLEEEIRDYIREANKP